MGKTEAGLPESDFPGNLPSHQAGVVLEDQSTSRGPGQGVESLGGGESGAQSAEWPFGLPQAISDKGRIGEDLAQVPAALRSLGEASSRGFHNFWTG